MSFTPKNHFDNRIDTIYTSVNSNSASWGSFTSVSSDIIPFADNTYSLGTLALMWKDIYTNSGIFSSLTAFLYWGDNNTEGSWRIGLSGNNFIFQRYETDAWITKQTINA